MLIIQILYLDLRGKILGGEVQDFKKYINYYPKYKTQNLKIVLKRIFGFQNNFLKRKLKTKWKK